MWKSQQTNSASAQQPSSSGGKVSKWKQKLTTPSEGDKSINQKKANQQSVSFETQNFTLQVHNNDYSEEELLMLNVDLLDGAIREGDYLEVSFQMVQVNNSAPSIPQSFNSINSQQSQSQTGVRRILIKLSAGSLRMQKNEQARQQKLQISMLKQIADIHGVKSNMICKLRVVSEDSQNAPNANNTRTKLNSIDEYETQQPISLEAFVIDRVEISFRDQFVSRRDMWLILNCLNSKTVYKNKSIDCGGIRFRIRGLYNKEGQEILNGLCRTTQTKFAFWTRSCQIYLLVEVSEDMYNFDEDGFINYEKTIAFLKSYCERCVKQSATHEITIIMYSRLYYPQVTNQDQLREALSKFYDSPELLTDEEINEFGAFQISKHTKVFQDLFLKVGLFELGRGSWEKVLQNLRKYFAYYPSMINWKIGCPKHVQELIYHYPRCNLAKTGFFSTFEDFKCSHTAHTATKHYMLECQLGNAEKQCILEAINLALFNLNNEEEDQNLKTTGQQMLIVTAGSGAYRVNAEIVNPTKSRVLLGGIPIQIVSMSKKPPYKTPLLINCCTYQNPFKTKTQNFVMGLGALSPYGGVQGYESPTSINGRGINERLNSSFQMHENSPTSNKDVNKPPPFFFPYWIDIQYLHNIKLFESHKSQVQPPNNAIYKIQKLAPNYNFKPHQTFGFLDDVSQMEAQMLKQLKKNQNYDQYAVTIDKPKTQLDEEQKHQDQNKEQNQHQVSIDASKFVLHERKLKKEEVQILSKYFDSLGNLQLINLQMKKLLMEKLSSI